jgi:hypothetical protein
MAKSFFHYCPLVPWLKRVHKILLPSKCI